MKELIQQQKKWELDRGIVNPNHSLDRVQLELNEAKEEPDPLLRLIEMVDVVIILAGGMAQICDENDLPYDEVDKLIEMKIMTNSIKYRLDLFEGRSPKEAIELARRLWAEKPPIET